MKDFERVADTDREADALRVLQGQFSFKDFYDQLSMIQKMGPLKDIIAKLPIQGMLPKDINVDDRELDRIKAMIDSMTKEERTDPRVFNDSRVRRIAKGSGRSTKDVTDLIKKFMQMRQMMGMLGKNMGLLGKIPGLGQLSQLGNLRKMASQMGGMGGMPGGMGGMPGMGDLAGMMPPGMSPGMFGGLGAPRKVDRDKQKKLRKDAKKARKKNRKK
jgi:signal recognition particle subunit SRP54